DEAVIRSIRYECQSAAIRRPRGRLARPARIESRLRRLRHVDGRNPDPSFPQERHASAVGCNDRTIAIAKKSWRSARHGHGPYLNPRLKRAFGGIWRTLARTVRTVISSPHVDDRLAVF